MGEQSFRILCLLLDAQGEIVTREELRTKLWASDTFVDFDHGLNSAVQRLRDCLSDSAGKPNWIETIPRRGYRFVGRADFRDGNGVATNSENDTEPPQTPEAPSNASPRVNRRTMSGWVVAAAGFLLVMTGLAVGYRLYAQSQKRQAARRIRSLAVLPLENLSGDPGQDYFADGMTDELTTILAKNVSLRVISRTSAMQYKGVHRPLRDIARELGVDGILEGSVARAGGRIHLNVQLIYAPTDSHVWADSYDRDFNEIYMLPEELSQRVAREVKTATSPAPPQRYISPEAHDAYLQGRYFWYGNNPDRSLEYFEKAIRLQPDYAAAWSGLADSYGMKAILDDCPTKDAADRMENTARKAVAIDDSSAEAHTSLAAWYFFLAWDLPHAETESQRSLELNPNYADAHLLRSYILYTVHRLDESLEEEKLATRLDPMKFVSELGDAYRARGQYDESIAELLRRSETSANQAFIDFGLAEAYWLKGMKKESVEEWEKVYSGDPARASALREAYKVGGPDAAAQWLLHDKKAAATRSGCLLPFEMALRYAFLGDRNNVLKYLEISYQERYPWLIMVQSEPMFDFVHSEPRYQVLIKKIGLPPAY